MSRPNGGQSTCRYGDDTSVSQDGALLVSEVWATHLVLNAVYNLQALRVRRALVPHGDYARVSPFAVPQITDIDGLEGLKCRATLPGGLGGLH